MTDIEELEKLAPEVNKLYIKTLEEQNKKLQAEVERLQKENEELKEYRRLYTILKPIRDQNILQAEEKGFTRGVEWLKTLAAEHGHTVTVGKMALKEAFYNFQSKGAE